MEVPKSAWHHQNVIKIEAGYKDQGPGDCKNIRGYHRQVESTTPVDGDKGKVAKEKPKENMNNYLLSKCQAVSKTN